MNVTETPEVQLARLFEALQNPVGIFFALVALVLFVSMAASRSGRWGLVAMLLYFSPMMVSVAIVHRGLPAITPFQQFRTYGRPICGTMLVLLLLPALFTSRGWRRKLVGAPAIAYILFQSFYSIRIMFAGTPLRGAIGEVIFLLTFVVLGIGLGHWLQDLRDVRALLRAVGWAGLAFAGCTLIQVVVNKSAVVAGSRLYGLTGNPQAAGMTLACCFPAIAFLCVWNDETKPMRMFWALCTPLIVVMLLWTGSRTAGITVLVTVLIMFRRHIGRFLGFGIVAALLLLVAFQFTSSDVGTMSERFLSINDSGRFRVWQGMWNDFLRSPLVGVPAEETLGSESSYLLIASRTGVIGLALILLVLGTSFWALLTVHSYRKLLREQSMLVDTVVGGLAGLLAGAFFEGYLVGTLVPTVFMLYVYLGLITFLIDAAAVQAHYPAEPMAVEFEGQLEPAFAAVPASRFDSHAGLA